MKKLLRAAASLLPVLYAALLCFSPYPKRQFEYGAPYESDSLFFQMETQNAFIILKMVKDDPLPIIQAVITFVLVIVGLLNLSHRDEKTPRIYCGISAAVVLWHFLLAVCSDLDSRIGDYMVSGSGMRKAGWCAFLILILAVAALPRKAKKQPEESELPAMGE